MISRARIALQSADRVDRLRDVFGAAGRRSLEEHVLDKMRDAALLVRLVPRPACEPHADTDGPHMRHPFGKQPETVRKHVTDDEWLRHECFGSQRRGQRPPAIPAMCRKSLTDRELEEQLHDITRTNCAAICHARPPIGRRDPIC